MLNVALPFPLALPEDWLLAYARIPARPVSGCVVVDIVAGACMIGGGSSP